MSQTEPVRVDLLDFSDRGKPHFNINIGRRTRREDRTTSDSHTGDITRKKEALGGEPISIVMLSMPRRLDNLQLHFSGSNYFVVLRDSNRVFRNSFDRAPEIVHLLSVNTGCTSHQPGRIDHVRRSFRMNVDNGAEFFLPAPSSTVVIEMNVGRKKLSNMLRIQPA